MCNRTRQNARNTAIKSDGSFAVGNDIVCSSRCDFIPLLRSNKMYINLLLSNDVQPTYNPNQKTVLLKEYSSINAGFGHCPAAQTTFEIEQHLSLHPSETDSVTCCRAEGYLLL